MTGVNVSSRTNHFLFNRIQLLTGLIKAAVLNFEWAR